ncbi:sulfatase [Achromobacter insuavis]
MLELVVGSLLPAWLLGLVASWALEYLLQPRPVVIWRRSRVANLTHIGVWSLLFALELALFRRPYFAMANVLAIALVLVLVSRAKYHSMREPFVYPDFEYFTDAIKHPRLYLPFFGWGNALAAIGGYGVALWLGLAFESPIAASIYPLFLPSLAGLALAGLLLAVWAGSRVAVVFDAEVDMRRQGLVAALWAYGRAERKGSWRRSVPAHLSRRPCQPSCPMCCRISSVSRANPFLTCDAPIQSSMETFWRVSTCSAPRP